MSDSLSAEDEKLSSFCLNLGACAFRSSVSRCWVLPFNAESSPSVSQGKPHSFPKSSLVFACQSDFPVLRRRHRARAVLRNSYILYAVARYLHFSSDYELWICCLTSHLSSLHKHCRYFSHTGDTRHYKTSSRLTHKHRYSVRPWVRLF